MDELETIFSSNSPIECYIQQSKLENEGVECFIFDENIVSVHPFLANAIGGVKLKVRSEQKLLAEEILSRVEPDLSEESDVVDPGNEAQTKDREMITCPYCGSNNVYYGQAIDYKWNIPYLVLSFLMSVPLPFIRKKCHCFDCHSSFKIKR